MVFSISSPPQRYCVNSYGRNRKQISDCRQSWSWACGRSSPSKTVRRMEQVSYVSSNQPVTRSFSLPTANSPKMRTSLSSRQKNLNLLLRAQTLLSLTARRLLLPPAANVKIVHMPVAKAIISLVPDVEGFVLPGETGSLVGASHCAGASTVVGCPLFFASCLYNLLLGTPDVVVSTGPCHKLCASIPCAISLASINQGALTISKSLSQRI